MKVPNVDCILQALWMYEDYVRKHKSLPVKNRSAIRDAYTQLNYLQGWLAALDTMVEKFTSTNSDYAAALRVWDEYERQCVKMCTGESFADWCKRLNSEEPNCA